jgi:hypothetical protein
MKALGLALLGFACLHEFVWQLFQPDAQGDVRSVTQWGLIASLCWLLHVVARSRWLSAVCAAVVVMSSTTAACSAYWLATRFAVVMGEEQCSRQWSMPMMLLSAVAALAVFWFWTGEKNVRER